MTISLSCGKSFCEIRKVPAGNIKLEESAYLISLEDGRKTVEIMSSQKAEISALREIIISKDIQIDKLLNGIEDLNNNIKIEC